MVCVPISREALVNEFGTALITAMSGPNDEWRRMQGAPPPIGHNGGPAPDPDPVGTTITLFAATVAVNQSQRPALAQWLRDLFDAGNQFNRDMRANYRYNEVEVRNANGVVGRVDSYNPGREIVERKFTQLSSIQEATARGYINELVNNYPAGSTITNSRFNASLLRGTELRGTPILEVPVQRAPVPSRVLDYASERGVIIRDSQGRVLR